MACFTQLAETCFIAYKLLEKGSRCPWHQKYSRSVSGFREGLAFQRLSRLAILYVCFFFFFKKPVAMRIGKPYGNITVYSQGFYKN